MANGVNNSEEEEILLNISIKVYNWMKDGQMAILDLFTGIFNTEKIGDLELIDKEISFK